MAESLGGDHPATHDTKCPGARVPLETAIEVLVNNTCSHMGVGGLWPDGAERLAAALTTNTAMTMLDLNEFNEIGDQGAIALGAALKLNRGLTSLFIANNGITEEGAAAIADALDPFAGGNTALKVRAHRK
jgi:hypothetical protein